MTDDVVAILLWAALAAAVVYWLVVVLQVPLAWPWEPVR